MAKSKDSTVPAAEQEQRYWFSRHSKSIVFLISMLAVVGVYEAFSLPIAVFPATNFPRIVIGVDNGVMPITRRHGPDTLPIEKAVNSVTGLQDHRSVTSVDAASFGDALASTEGALETLQLVNSAIARV